MSSWIKSVDWSGGGSTSPGTARAEDPRSGCRRIGSDSLAGAVPGKSVASVTEINAISQERCTEIRMKFQYIPTFYLEPFFIL